MKKNLFLKEICSIMTVGILISCQSGITENFNANNSPSDWVGETPLALTNAWGKPTQILNAHGYQYLIYLKAENINFTENEGQAGIGPLQMIDGYPQVSPIGNLFCQTTFVVQSDEIINALWQGDGCSY